MNSFSEERLLINSLEKEALLADARQLAAAGGGLPAVMAGLQTGFGQSDEAAGELAAEAFGLSAISLAELSEYSLALTLAPFDEFIRRQVLVATLDIIIGWAGIVTILVFFGYASDYLETFPRDMLLAWVLIAPLLMFLGQLVLRLSMHQSLVTGINRKKAVIVGMGELGIRLAREIQASPYLGIDAQGFFDDRSAGRLSTINAPAPLLGRIDSLTGYTRETGVDIIYITLPMTTQPRILKLLDDLRDTTVSINFVPDIFVTDLIQGHVDSINGIPVVGVCDTPFYGINGIVKRGSDILLSTLILLLISPLMLAIALGIKLGSPGPVLFVQRRYGLDGKEILVYKFRSMTVCEDGDQIRQATRSDKRITRLGAFLRKTSLDELPQFINVLQGRMSIVGPRPHAVAHNEMYRKLIKGYMVRHKVKPGITGWAQVNGHRGETEKLEKMEARIEFDLDYLRNWSIKLDLAIIARTVLVVMNDKQAY